MPDLTLLHLTDIHMADPSGPTWWDQDAGANLQSVVDTVSNMTVEVAAIIVSGDLVNQPSVANYEAYNQASESLRSMGAPVFLSLGNHDDRSLFRQCVLGMDGGADCTRISDGLTTLRAVEPACRWTTAPRPRT